MSMKHSHSLSIMAWLFERPLRGFTVVVGALAAMTANSRSLSVMRMRRSARRALAVLSRGADVEQLREVQRRRVAAVHHAPDSSPSPLRRRLRRRYRRRRSPKHAPHLG